MKDPLITQDLAELREQGVLSPENAARLEDYYQKKENRNYRYFAWVIALIGILLIVSGVGLLCSFLWGSFPLSAKLALSALPLAAGAVCAFYTFTSSPGLPGREISALLNFIGIAFFTFMVISLYRIHPQMQCLVFLALAIALALIYIFGSAILTFFYAAGILLGGQFIFDCPAEKLVALAAILPFVLTHLKSNYPERIVIRYAVLLLAVWGAICLNFHYPVLPWMALTIVLLLGGWEIYLRRQEHFLGNPWLLAAFAALLALLAVTSSSDRYFQIAAVTPVMRTAYWVSTGIVLAVLAVVFPRRRWDAKRLLPMLLVLGMILPLCTGITPGGMRIFVNSVGALLGVALIFNGVKKYQFVLFHGGLLVLAVLIGCRFFDRGISVPLRAGGLIALGVIFIIANLIFVFTALRRRERQLPEAENREEESR